MEYINLLILLLVASVTGFKHRLRMRADNQLTADLINGDLLRRSMIERPMPRNFRRGTCPSKCIRKSRPDQPSQRRNPSSPIVHQTQPELQAVRTLRRERNGSDRVVTGPVTPAGPPPRHSGSSGSTGSSGAAGSSGAGGSSQRSESPQVVPDAQPGSHPESPVAYITRKSPYLVDSELGL